MLRPVRGWEWIVDQEPPSLPYLRVTDYEWARRRNGQDGENSAGQRGGRVWHCRPQPSPDSIPGFAYKLNGAGTVIVRSKFETRGSP